MDKSLGIKKERKASINERHQQTISIYHNVVAGNPVVDWI